MLHRQKVSRLQEMTKTLMHTKSRSDPFAKVGRAPMAARTASTPALQTNVSSPNGQSAAIEAEVHSAAAEPLYIPPDSMAGQHSGVRMSMR